MLEGRRPNTPATSLAVTGKWSTQSSNAKLLASLVRPLRPVATTFGFSPRICATETTTSSARSASGPRIDEWSCVEISARARCRAAVSKA